MVSMVSIVPTLFFSDYLELGNNEVGRVSKVSVVSMVSVVLTLFFSISLSLGEMR